MRTKNYEQEAQLKVAILSQQQFYFSSFILAKVVFAKLSDQNKKKIENLEVRINTLNEWILTQRKILSRQIKTRKAKFFELSSDAIWHFSLFSHCIICSKMIETMFRIGFKRQLFGRINAQ